MAAGEDQTDRDEGDGEGETAMAARGKAEVPTLDKRALVQRVVTTSGLPVQQAKRLIDIVLAEIGAGIDAGASLSLAPLGKLRPVRRTESGGAAVHTLRLRRMPAKVAEDEAEGEVMPGARARARVKAGAAARRGSDGAEGTKAKGAGKGKPRGAAGGKTGGKAAGAPSQNSSGDEDDGDD